MNSLSPIGKVIIAGAGPGDADLITIKLQKALATAHVIITDRLVNPEIIELHAAKNAVVVLAGKQGYNEDSFSQEEVCALIVKYALEGKTVLRLKGGDVAFFSNVLDELLVLQQHQLPFEIIPGITAASGASAYAGIPLTARGFSQGVQFITFNPGNYSGSDKWGNLAGTNDTLVFYMAAKNIDELAERLLLHTHRPQTPLAVIEQATTIHQRTHLSTLENCRTDFAGKQFSSPSLVIVGEVVELHRSFSWFNNGETAGTIFNDLLPKQ